MLCPWFIERLILPLWRNPDSSIWEIIACEIQNPGNSCLCNPESWALQSGLQFKEYRIPLITGIRNPSSIDKETGFQELESGIHCVESRIQNCPGVQPPSQALRFLHRGGERETRASDTWEWVATKSNGSREGSPFVSFPLSFASIVRETFGYEAAWDRFHR